MHQTFRDFATAVLSMPVYDGVGGSSVSAQRVVMLAIIVRQGKPTRYEDLAEMTGLGTRTVHRAVEDLQLANLIFRGNDGYQNQDGGTVWRSRWSPAQAKQETPA